MAIAARAGTPRLLPAYRQEGFSGVEDEKNLFELDQASRFDCNVVVIGAGSAGLVSAYIAAAVKARVTLVEKDRMGGDCLNSGCVPSKALIRSARLLSTLRRSAELGLRSASVDLISRTSWIVSSVSYAA